MNRQYYKSFDTFCGAIDKTLRKLNPAEGKKGMDILLNLKFQLLKN